MELQYTFPHITNISDVLPHIDEEHFRVVEKDGLIFINYRMMGSDTFPDINHPVILTDFTDNHSAAVRRECRGIVFDAASGDIVSRPFHKFFNRGEKEALNHQYVSDMLAVTRFSEMEKLDGSMLRPLPIEGGVRWGTKMGITDVGMLSETSFGTKENIRKFGKMCLDAGITCLFEFCSNKSRIVLGYPEERFVLLAVRYNISGNYLLRHQLEGMAAEYNLDLVQEQSVSLEDVDGAEDIEGTVVWLENGHAFKEKSTWYRDLHRVKDKTSTERRLVEVMFNEQLDDLLPICDVDTRAKLLVFNDTYMKAMIVRSKELDVEYKRIRAQFETRKDFALSNEFNTIPVAIKGLYFSLWNGKADSMWDALMRKAEGGSESETKYGFSKEEKYEEFKFLAGTDKIVWEP